MNRIDRGIAVGLIGSAAALGGCSSEGAGSGSGGAGGGEPTPVPREIEVALVAEPDAQLDSLAVFHNAADGRLLGSLNGAGLPASLTVQDGDWVSYAYELDFGLPDGERQRIRSYRVEPGVERIEWDLRFALRRDFACQPRSVELRVTVPAVEGATEAFVQASTGHFATASSLPAEVVVHAGTYDCDLAELALFVGAKGRAFEAVAVVEGIPFESGAALELAPELTPPPRTSFELDISGLEEALETSVQSAWKGEVFHSLQGPWFEPEEEASVSLHGGDSPFGVVHTPMNLPLGHPRVSVQATLTNQSGSCGRSSSFGRVGESDTPLSFDASALAEARPEGEASYGLEPERERGDYVWQRWMSGETSWQLMTDPLGTPSIFGELELPAELPTTFARPTAPFELRALVHGDDDRVEGYAAYVATTQWAVPGTGRSRSFAIRCDDAQ
jgi:hypothetical protein